MRDVHTLPVLCIWYIASIWYEVNWSHSIRLTGTLASNKKERNIGYCNQIPTCRRKTSTTYKDLMNHVLDEMWTKDDAAKNKIDPTAALIPPRLVE